MPMEILLCRPIEGLADGGTVRAGAKAETMGADRTAAADATVTNESLILSISFRARFRRRSDIMCWQINAIYTIVHCERSHVRTNGADIQLRVLCGLESKWPLAFSLRVSKRECLPSAIWFGHLSLFFVRHTSCDGCMQSTSPQLERWKTGP